jgi:hypothetical protein
MMVEYNTFADGLKYQKWFKNNRDRAELYTVQ